MVATKIPICYSSSVPHFGYVTTLIDKYMTRAFSNTICSIYHSLQSSWMLHIWHYGDVLLSAMPSQMTSRTIVYSTVYSGADQRKHQSSASLAFVRGIHRSPVNSPHKGPVTRKIFPLDGVIMKILFLLPEAHEWTSNWFYFRWGHIWFYRIFLDFSVYPTIF